MIIRLLKSLYTIAMLYVFLFSINKGIRIVKAACYVTCLKAIFHLRVWVYDWVWCVYVCVCGVCGCVCMYVGYVVVCVVCICVGM